MCSNPRRLACALALVLASCAPGRRDATAPTRPPTEVSGPVTAAPAPSSRPEPVAAPRAPATPSEADPRQMREHIDSAVALAASFARERDRSAARTTAARALHALADAIQVAPARYPRARVAALAWDVRSEAERLARADDLSLQRSDFAKGGLLAATLALEQIAAAPAGSLLARLIANAHEAVRAIDTSSPFLFERARIQDALRAVTDAFLVFAERPRPTTVGKR